MEDPKLCFQSGLVTENCVLMTKNFHIAPPFLKWVLLTMGSLQLLYRMKWPYLVYYISSAALYRMKWPYLVYYISSVALCRMKWPYLVYYIPSGKKSHFLC